MAIRFTCDCGQTLAAGDEHAGKRVRCSACNAIKVVPGAPPAAVPVAAAPAGLVLLLGVGVWLLFFRGSGKPDNPDGSGDAAANAFFDAVPGDALGFASVRVAEVLKTDIGKKALALARELSGEDMKNFE